MLTFIFYCLAPSFELSGSDNDNADGLEPMPMGRTSNDRQYNSELSLSSLNENDPYNKSNGLRPSAANRRGSQSSLSSVETKHEPRKHKLNIRRVLRKHSKESNGGGGSPRSLRAEKKSPVPSRKASSNDNAGDSSPPCDSVSQQGSEQDIDAMFKDYESEHSKNTPQEFTGSCCQKVHGCRTNE